MSRGMLRSGQPTENILYPVLYSGEMLKSWASTGTYGCANWFEFDAGLQEGRYRSC